MGDGVIYSCQLDKIAANRTVTNNVLDLSIAWWLFCLLTILAVGVPGLFMIRAGTAFQHFRSHQKIESPRQRFRGMSFA